jgi:hypothetical protein
MIGVSESKQLSVSVVTEASVWRGAEWTELDISFKSARVLLENAALTDLRLAGHQVDNL